MSDSAGPGRRYSLLDVFTDTSFTGNPLAVFEEGEGLSVFEMQRLARELNLSESVFLLPPAAGGDARLRIFTPALELPFAGHPVLGAAFLLSSRKGGGPVVLETAAGSVPVSFGEKEPTVGWMAQPLPRIYRYERAGEVLAALGLEAAVLPLEAYENGPVHLCVALESPEQVARLRPDMAALSGHAGLGVSCFAGEAGRFKTRMFGPALGVSEDPATGSAAGPVCLHLARHGRVGFGETIELSQGEEIGRPSLLFARVTGSPAAIGSVEVGGAAVVVGRGEITAG